MEKLTPLKPQNRPVKDQFFVLDIETKGRDATPENFAFCCMHGSGGSSFFYSPDEIKKELQHRKYRGKFIFAHFAEFDFSGIYGNIYETDPAAIFSGSQLITFTNGNCKFGDSMNLLKSSVAKVGDALGLPKLESQEIFQQLQAGIITDQAREYCERDCMIVYRALLEIFETVGRVRLTIASAALSYFRQDYQHKDIWFDREKSDKFFQSYYGGRVEAFKLGPTFSHKYDVNSLYPFVMKETHFPDPGNLKEYQGETDYFVKFILGKPQFEGMASVTIRHAKTEFPALPYRQSGKLIFPTGEFTGAWNFNELRNALKSGHVEILEFHGAYYSRGIKSPFSNYIDTVYNLRLENSGNFRELVYKYLLNSLYGKWGQRKKYKRIYFKELPVEKIRELKNEGQEFKIINFGKKRKDGYLEIAEIKPPRHGIAVFASYIASAARVHLHQLLTRYSSNSITYCDTDCICVEIPGIPTGSSLGDLKLEKEKLTMIRGAKDYTQIRPDGSEDEKIKGIPKKATKQDGIYTFDQFTKTGTSIRTGRQAGTWIKATKQPTGNYTKRQTAGDQFTEAWDLIADYSQQFDTPGRPEIQLARENWQKISTSDLIRHTHLTTRDFRRNYHTKNGCSLDYFAENLEITFREFGINREFNEIRELIIEIATGRD